jgi:hypothetical protein
MQFYDLINAISLLEIIPVILVIILMLWSVFTRKGRDRNLSFLVFLISLCFTAGSLVVTLMRNNLITATDWFNWAVYVDFGVRGIFMFLIALYVIIWAYPDFLSQKKWVIIVALIGPIVFEILMFSNFSISTTYGPAFWITMLVIGLLYMAVIPIMATIHRTRKDDILGSPMVKWIWVVMLGLLFWFFGDAYLALSQFLELPGHLSMTSQGALTIISVHTIGWYLILLGFVFQKRTSQADTS